jgi:hypothetical protein
LLEGADGWRVTMLSQDASKRVRCTSLRVLPRLGSRRLTRLTQDGPDATMRCSRAFWNFPGEHRGGVVRGRLWVLHFGWLRMMTKATNNLVEEGDVDANIHGVRPGH